MGSCSTDLGNDQRSGCPLFSISILFSECVSDSFALNPVDYRKIALRIWKTCVVNLKLQQFHRTDQVSYLKEFIIAWHDLLEL